MFTLIPSNTAFQLTRKPRVLLIAAESCDAAAWRCVLDKSGCRVFGRPEAVTTRDAAAHYRIDAMVCVTAVRALAPASMGVPVIAVGPWDRVTTSGDLAMPRITEVQLPADPRHVVALVHAAAAGRSGDDVTPVPVGDGFALVPAMAMVFWQQHLLRLATADRRLLCALLQAPGRVFGWDEVVCLTGGARSSGYLCALRIRKLLRFIGAPAERLETYRGRGVTWTEASRGDGHPGHDPVYHHES